MPSTEPVSWASSRTLWVNGITMGIAILGVVTMTTSADGSSIIPAEAMPYILLAQSIAGIILRFLTNAPLKPLAE